MAAIRALAGRLAISEASRASSPSIWTSARSSTFHRRGADEMNGLNIHPSMRLRIQHFWESRLTPYIG
jgi:hypothetical protein